MVLQYFRVIDDIVKDSIEAMIEAKEDESLMIVGGMAIQLYSNDPELMRPTSDIDIFMLPNISYEEFSKNIGNKIKEKITKKYQCQLKRGRYVNEVKIMDGQHTKAKQLFFMHFTSYSDEFIKKYQKILEREVDYSRTITLPYSYNNKKIEVKVKRIEDILPHKITRLKRNIQYIPDPLKRSILEIIENTDWHLISNIPLKNWKNEIVEMQSKMENLDKKNIDQKILSCYVSNKDLYDIVLLSKRIIEEPSLFNLDYYLKATEELKQAKLVLME